MYYKIIYIMGANVSDQSQESVSKLVNDSLTDISTSVSNSSSVFANSNQQITLDFWGKVEDCPFNIYQTADVSISAMLKADSDISAAVANKIENKLAAIIDSSVKQANKGLNLGQVGVSLQSQKATQDVTNKLQAIIKNSINNTLRVDAMNDQKIDVIVRGDMNCRGQQFNITQEAVVKAVSDAAAKTIVSTVVKNDVFNDLKQQLAQKALQENTGLDLGFGFAIIFVVVVGIAALLYVGSTWKCELYALATVLVGLYIMDQFLGSPLGKSDN
jgi:membrane-associated HD superfamily phosphohydrolase